MNMEEKRKALQKLYNSFRQCNECPYQKNDDDHRVFGAGNLNARILFIGEAPGEQEDTEKKPFVGRAGKLLNNCMQKAGFKREDVFITNIVKCRPPNNRTPLPEEITPELKELLKKEIEIIQPKVICTLGATAAQALLNKKVSMSALRGTFSPYDHMILMHTYHPAYIFRNRNAESELVKDLFQAFELSKKS